MIAFEVSSLGESVQKRANITPLGSISTLFPFHGSKSHQKRFGLTSKEQLTVEVTAIRWGHYAALLSQDQSLLLNTYWFPSTMSNPDVFSFLKDNYGWLPKQRSRIAEALSHPKARKEYAKALYEWEDETLPSISLTENQINGLMYTYLGDQASLNFYNMEEYGKCLITRFAGLASKPYHLEIAINHKSKFLWVVLHEIAHALDYLYYRSFGHGPTFLRLYAKLLEKHYGIDYWPSMKINIIGK